VRPHLRHTSRLAVGLDGTQPGQLVLTFQSYQEPTPNPAPSRSEPGAAVRGCVRRAVRQGLRFMLRGRVLCGSVFDRPARSSQITTRDRAATCCSM
jgi:hypothetical protein